MRTPARVQRLQGGGYSKKYLAEHEADIALHRSAQGMFRRLLDGSRLPEMDALKAEGGRLAAEKKSLYAQYRAAQKWMRNLRRLFRRGLEATEDHYLLSATALNLKHMVRCLG